MKNLPIRVFSAVAAVLLLLVVNHLWGAIGLAAAGAALCIVGSFEFKKIVLEAHGMPRVLRWWFLFVCTGLLVLSAWSGSYLLETWGILIATYYAGALWIERNRVENDRLLHYLALSGLGFLYCALLPSFALKIIRLGFDNFWFMFLLLTVFAGDTFAYFGGILFGKTKLMERVSPNKTGAGSIAGAFGSIAVAVALGLWLMPALPSWKLAIVGLFVAILAQNGDLFESLLKRVGNFKDSGHFMPGHGGVLDRFDGIYFAAPLVYAAAQVLT